MEKILTEQQLDAKLQECTENLEKKIAGKDGKKHLVVCGGTGCISSNSNEILANLKQLIKYIIHKANKIT